MKNIVLMSLLLTLSACGGSSDSTAPDKEVLPPPPSTYTGVFLDSAVEGLNYSTNSQSGTTNAGGEFLFQADELITFSIGGITFPAISAELILTPLSLFKSSDINQLEVVNTLRLLQSLDSDGDLTNNIQIPEIAHELAQDLTVDFSDENFEDVVSGLITMIGSVHQQLVSAQSAIDHFQQTLNLLSNENPTSCESTHTMVGYSGFFETFHHNVAGKATIIDDCTIEISQFDYDGGGPDVYFYGAINHKYNSTDAFPIGNKLNGQIYNNATITIKLPQNKTLDDLTGLSVWCVDFSADFGHMEFTP
ncbi:DM13 domain-containing protein [Litorilituus lipolyticus]|uniref:DM13 domain-containing protein n=1 Tax=Litorilituus lipolyticus TaxID=2491017 RepID=A0A502KX17_9GAMM|nr:DM13 domain-containing protein [Litorilituus lipolyticus]TPH15644.1 hypothetical protein EPA86_08705 [Litorilituus lipolyticus]